MTCAAKNKQGKRCGAHAVHGRKTCVLHTPGLAAKFGEKGGRRRARFNPDEVKPITEPQNAADLQKAIAQAIVEVHAGKLEPRVANSLAYLASAFISTLQVSDFAERIAALEARHKAMKESA